MSELISSFVFVFSFCALMCWEQKKTHWIIEISQCMLPPRDRSDNQQYNWIGALVFPLFNHSDQNESAFDA